MLQLIHKVKTRQIQVLKTLQVTLVFKMGQLQLINHKVTRRIQIPQLQS